MSLQSYLSEIDSIQTELTRLNKIITPLRKRKKELEECIQNQLEKKNMTEIKYKKKTYKITEGTTRQRKNEYQKTEDTNIILMKYGIRNNQEMVNEIMSAQKGDISDCNKLKIKNNKNY